MSGLRRRFVWSGAALGALLLAAAIAWAAEGLRTSAAPAHISIDATPITSFDNRDPSRVRFGALEFRGGLVLTSSYKAFGGVSALHMEADGAHFLAVTDNGSWLKARIVYDNGRPASIADAEMAPALASDGTPLAAHGWFDLESLAAAGDGAFYVGIERVERIVRFDLRKDGLAAHGQPIKVPADFKSCKYNKSLECLAVPPAGSPHAGDLLAVTERSLDAQGNHRAFILNGDRVERFSVRRSDDFDISDCAVLPPGDLLLLERSFSLTAGVAMRIRRVPLSAIKDGALVDGAPLVTADMGYQIDNMEGLGVHRNAQGETILTLVSDDNFSAIQRNLLLQFALVGE
ncbi:MAG: esterase-like activity of phytase family protein [Pseudolabrys sp.]